MTENEYIETIRTVARSLRAAKEAHTKWETSFEGFVPKHDWEVWYAQFLTRLAREDAPLALNMAKLHTLVGPLS